MYAVELPTSGNGEVPLYVVPLRNGSQLGFGSNYCMSKWVTNRLSFVRYITEHNILSTHRNFHLFLYHPPESESKEVTDPYWFYNIAEWTDATWHCSKDHGLRHWLVIVCQSGWLCLWGCESNTTAHQGTALLTFLFTIYPSDFHFNSGSCHLQKFLDDSSIV